MNPNVRKAMMDRIVNMAETSSGFIKLCEAVKTYSESGKYLADNPTVYSFNLRSLRDRLMFECVFEKPGVETCNQNILIHGVRFSYAVSNAYDLFQSYAPVTVPNVSLQEINDVNALFEHMGRLFVFLDCENAVTTAKSDFDSCYRMMTSSLTTGTHCCCETRLNDIMRTISFTLFDTTSNF